MEACSLRRLCLDGGAVVRDVLVGGPLSGTHPRVVPQGVLDQVDVPVHERAVTTTIPVDIVNPLEGDTRNNYLVVLERDRPLDNSHGFVFADDLFPRCGNRVEPVAKVVRESVPVRTVLLTLGVQDTSVHAHNGALNDLRELVLHDNHLSARLRQCELRTGVVTRASVITRGRIPKSNKPAKQ